VARIFVTEG
jgi:hypothetical protein